MLFWDFVMAASGSVITSSSTPYCPLCGRLLWCSLKKVKLFCSAAYRPQCDETMVGSTSIVCVHLFPAVVVAFKFLTLLRQVIFTELFASCNLNPVFWVLRPREKQRLIKAQLNCLSLRTACLVAISTCNCSRVFGRSRERTRSSYGKKKPFQS